MSGFAAFKASPLSYEPCMAVGFDPPTPLQATLEAAEPLAWPVALVVTAILCAGLALKAPRQAFDFVRVNGPRLGAATALTAGSAALFSDYLTRMSWGQGMGVVLAAAISLFGAVVWLEQLVLARRVSAATIRHEGP